MVALSRMQMALKSVKLPFFFLFVSVLIMPGCSSINKGEMTGFPRFSKDGDRVIMSAKCGELRSAFFVIDIEKRKVINKYMPKSEISFGPQYIDDKRVLYSCKKIRNVCPDYCLEDMMSGEFRRITSGGYGGKSFVFLEKKEKILFSSACINGNLTMKKGIEEGISAKYDLFSVDIDGANRNRLTNTESYGMRGLSATRDNRRVLLYRSKHKLVPSQMWLYEVEENKLGAFVPDLSWLFREVAEEKSIDLQELSSKWAKDNIYFFSISPSGNEIVFSMRFPYSTRGDGLYIADIATGAVRNIYPLGMEVRDLAFSPDGNMILIVEEGEDGYWNIWKINKDGSGLSEIVGGGQICKGI